MRNILLLTKESFVELKGKSFLYSTFLLFIIISFGLVLGLMHFSYSFNQVGEKFIKPNYYPNSFVKPINFELKDVNKKSNFYSYTEEILDKYGMKKDTDRFISDLGKNKGAIDKNKFPEIYDKEVNGFYRNFLLKFYASELSIEEKKDNLTTYKQIQAYKYEGKMKENDIKISFYKNKDESIPWWMQYKDHWDETIVDKGSNNKIKSKNEIMVTPSFLKKMI